MNLAISMLILVLPCVLGSLIVYWLLKQGILGRACLLCLLCLGAVEAHSIIYPQQQLKENYARMIG
ncbi:MAG: hypothetical protein K0Q67_2289 [Cellvibrio sp.]|jgi:hypothetical protein|nr:hypothetical protein [Cellvibrio sp.]